MQNNRKNNMHISQPDYGNDFCQSIARTNRLYCSCCGRHIKKGEMVTFELDHGKFESATCNDCSDKDDLMQISLAESDRHPFDVEGDC